MGKPFLDRSVTQGRALFVAYERHELTLQRALTMGLASCEDFMLWDKVAYRLPRVDSLDGWVGFIERNGVKLVVFDTLAHFLRPELEKVRNAINAYDHIYKVMETLQSAAVETGCTFVLIHHDRKGETAETDEARVLGTTALTASPDAVFQLKAMSDKVICLKATGNAIEETTLYFRVGENYWIELTDKPVTTKEEMAAREIENYLWQHGEATRQDLIRLLVEKGLAKASSAPVLLQRAIDDYLRYRLEKRVEGRQAIYRLKGESNRPSLPPAQPVPADSPQETRPVTPIENVTVVTGQPDQPEPTSNMCNTSNTNNNEYHVTGVTGQPEPDLQPDRRITTITSAICVMGLSNDPQGCPPEGSPQEAPPVNDLFVDFFDAGLLPDLIVEGNPPDNPTLPDRPDQSEGDQPAGNEPEGSPTLEPVSDQPCAQAQSEGSPQGSPEGDLQDKPEEIPPAQPFATLYEPICPVCGERLEPEPESGLAACLGCGRLFKVECPPVSPDDGDENPPNPQNNGHSGSQTGFAPPETPSIPPEAPTTPPADRIYTYKFNLSENQNRMTERLPDRIIKLVWQDKKKKTKTEIVAPNNLAGWQPIEEIPEISLPSIETVEIPTTVVLDLETTDKDPERGRILAAGLALYDKGKEVETLIIDSDNGERDLLIEVFDYLRATCDRYGEIVLTGYNIFDFDLTFLIERATKRNVKRQCPFYYLTDENGEIKRWEVAATDGTLKSDKLDYPAILVDRSLPIRIVDTLHLVCRWDYTAKQLIHYDLKSVAEHFGDNIPNRPVLTRKEIVHAYYHDRPKFNAYLLADLRETYALFAKLIPPYAGIAALTGLPLHLVAVKSTAWIWEQILKRHYNGSPEEDKKRDYVGGLVVSRKGLWSPCLKIDIASLYPTIMLAYRIHSRKDPEQIALRWLKTLREQRLALKEKAKANTGDPNAQILQEAMKILLNSLYGFYGTEGYGFNDMDAAEKVTAIGRKVLTRMIAAIEDLGGIVVEADTDGIIVCYRNADPEKILEAVNAAIPPVFKVELEWQEATVFVSDDKNYVVIDRNGKIETVKGGKWRGRDKPAYARKAIPTFLQLWATQGVQAALDYAERVLRKIQSGQGWDLVVQTHRVKEDDTNFINAGFEVGERALFAFKVRRKTVKDSEIAKSPDEGYDCDYYAAKFCETVKEVIAAIDPTQIAAWERMVGREARPLIFR